MDAKTKKAKTRLKLIVASARGNRLEQAEKQCQGMTHKQMHEEYGHSGRSRHEILAAYREERREWEAVKALVESLP